MTNEKEDSPKKSSHARSSHSSSLNRATIEQHLDKLQGNQDSIQSTSLWILHHKAEAAKIVQCWIDAFKRGVFIDFIIFYSFLHFTIKRF